MISRGTHDIFDGEHKTYIEAEGFGNTNTNDGHKRVAMVKEKNKPATAEHNFFQSQPVLIKYALADANHSEVVMQRPGNPYGPLDSLVVGIDDSMRAAALTPDQVSGRFIFEMSSEAQYKYWQVALAELVALEKLPEPQEENPIYDKPSRYHNVIMENTTPISYIDARYKNAEGNSPETSRTIYLPHLHVIKVDENWMKLKEWEMPHLDNEQAFVERLTTSRVGHEFLRTLSDDINRSTQDTPYAELIQMASIKAEPKRPNGYSVLFDSITPDNVLEHIDVLTHFMKSHFEAYRNSAALTQKQLRWVGQNNDITLIPQPSFRDYMYFQELDGKKVLTIRFSPEIFSHGGVMEAAGIKMDRGPQYKNPLSKGIVETYCKQWIKRVEQLTDKDRRFETYRIPYRETIFPHPVRENGRINWREWRRTNKNFPADEL